MPAAPFLACHLLPRSARRRRRPLPSSHTFSPAPLSSPSVSATAASGAALTTTTLTAAGQRHGGRHGHWRGERCRYGYGCRQGRRWRDDGGWQHRRRRERRWRWRQRQRRRRSPTRPARPPWRLRQGAGRSAARGGDGGGVVVFVVGGGGGSSGSISMFGGAAGAGDGGASDDNARRPTQAWARTPLQVLCDRRVDEPHGVPRPDQHSMLRRRTQGLHGRHAGLCFTRPRSSNHHRYSTPP